MRLRAESFCSEKISYHMTVSGLSDAHVVMHDSGRSMFYIKRRKFILGVGMGIGSNAGLIHSSFVHPPFARLFPSFGSTWIY